MSIETSDPLSVVQELNDASNANDLERILGLFDEDGVIRQIPPPPPPSRDVWAGKQAIREWFEPQLHNFRVDSRNIQRIGDIVAWNATISGDMLRLTGLDTVDITAEAIVKDGKITSFVVTETPESIQKWQAAMERRRQQAGSSA